MGTLAKGPWRKDLAKGRLARARCPNAAPCLARKRVAVGFTVTPVTARVATVAVGGIEALVGIDASALFAHVANTELSLVADRHEGAVGVTLAVLGKRLARRVLASTEERVAAAVLGQTACLSQHAARVADFRFPLRPLAAAKGQDYLARFLAARRRKGERDVGARGGANAAGWVGVGAPNAPFHALLKVEDVRKTDDLVRVAARGLVV